MYISDFLSVGDLLFVRRWFSTHSLVLDYPLQVLLSINAFMFAGGFLPLGGFLTGGFAAILCEWLVDRQLSCSLVVFCLLFLFASLVVFVLNVICCPSVGNVVAYPFGVVCPLLVFCSLVIFWLLAVFCWQFAVCPLLGFDPSVGDWMFQ